MSGLSEQDANIVAPRLIRSMMGEQHAVLSPLTKSCPSVADMYNIPGFFTLDGQRQDEGFFFQARLPEKEESPPVSGILRYVFIQSGRLRGSFAYVHVLRHAVQRWIMRGGGSSFADMCMDLQASMPLIGLFLSVWVEGPIILPTAKGIYLGELRREKGKDGRFVSWIELWTFADTDKAFRTPKAIRHRLYEEVLPSKDDWNIASKVSACVLSDTPIPPDLLFEAMPLFDRLRDIMDSDLWAKHVESRRKKGM